MRRGAVLAVGLAASVAITALMWALGFPGLFLFLALPLLWFPFSRATRAPRTRASCPSCGAPAQPTHSFCPSCGGRL